MPIWSVYSGYIPDFTLALPFKQLILNGEDGTVLRTIHLPRGLKGVKMGYIRERSLSDGSKRKVGKLRVVGCLLIGQRKDNLFPITRVRHGVHIMTA